MKILKNRTVLGVLCIAVSLFICLALTPLWNAGLTKTAGIVRVSKDIRMGEQISPDMLSAVEVGGHNLPGGIITDPEDAVGKYAAMDMVPGDHLFRSKLADHPSEENLYLRSLNGEMQAMSITIKSFAAGLSGKLMPGDIVAVITADYKNQGLTLTPPELQYVEVIAVTAPSGSDANTGESSSGDEDRELPSTVTLLVCTEQAHALAELEAAGRIHIALVYRGDAENAEKFTEAQAELIEEMRLAQLEEAENEDGEEPEYADTDAPTEDD